MLIYVDIDNTICKTEGGDYENAKPIKSRIAKINKLAEEHTIIYFSARGVVTGKKYMDLTMKQFKEWGVKYNNIRLQKPPFDLLIDDKAINANQYFNG